MKLTRKQKIAQQRDAAAQIAAEKVFGPIRAAIERGDLIITPLPQPPRTDRET